MWTRHESVKFELLPGSYDPLRTSQFSMSDLIYGSAITGVS